MPKITDIELGLKLTASDVKKAAQNLGKSIEDIFNKTAGKSLDSSLQNIQKQLSNTADKAKEVQEQMSKLETTKMATPEYTSATKQLEKATQSYQRFQEQTSSKIDAVKAKMEELAQVKTPTEQYKNLSANVEKLDGQLQKLGNESIKLQSQSQSGKVVARLQQIEIEADKLQSRIQRDVEAMQELENTGKAFTLGTDTAQYQNLQAQLNGYIQKGQQFKAEMDKAEQAVRTLVASGKDFTLGSDTAQYSKLSNKLADLNNQSRILINRFEEQSNTTRKTSDSMRSLANTTKEYAKQAQKASNVSVDFSKNLKRGLMTILKYGFGIRSLYFLFRKLRQAIIDGVKNMVLFEGETGRLNQSISSIQSSLATLKNQMGAAIAPLINAIAPAIVKIIDLLTLAIQKVAMFFAILSGKKTIMVADKVNKNFAAGLDKTASSAGKAKKALEGYLHPLDEINNQKTNDNNSGGAGGVDTGSFSEIPVDPKLLQWLEDLKNKLASLKKYWDAFKEGFMKGLGDDWQDKVERIKNALERIRKALIEIWTDPEVAKARENYFLSLFEMLGALLGTIFRIGLNIGVNLTEGIADALESKKEEIKKYLIEMFNIGTEVNKQLEEFFLTIGEITDTFTSEIAVKATSNMVQAFMEAFMLITENAARFGLALVKLITQPIIDNKETIKRALLDMFDTAADFWDLVQGILKDFRDMLSQIWKDHLNPAFEHITNGLSNLLTILLDAWHNYVHPLFKELMQILKDLWNGYLKDLFDNLMNCIGSLINILSMLFENYIVPHIKKVLDEYGPALQVLISVIMSVFKLAIEVISIGLDTLLTYSRAVLEFFEVGFTEGWGAAWDRVKEIFSDYMTRIQEKMDGVMNTIFEIVMKITDGIKLDISNKLSAILQNISSHMELVKGSIQLAITNIQGAINTATSFINGLLKSIQSVLQALVNFLKGSFASTWSSVWNTAASIFGSKWDGMLSKLKSVGNSMIGAVERIINSIVNGFNGIGDKISSAFSDIHIPDALGGGSFSINIPHLSTVSLPRLAQGAVIPPNDEFLAVLGDQKRGTNIEAPLDTMVQAFNIAAQANNKEEIALLQQQNQILLQILDKEFGITEGSIFKSVQKSVKQYKNRTGRDAFA